MLRCQSASVDIVNAMYRMVGGSPFCSASKVWTANAPSELMDWMCAPWIGIWRRLMTGDAPRRIGVPVRGLCTETWKVTAETGALGCMLWESCLAFGDVVWYMKRDLRCPSFVVIGEIA